jgi:uncharacterized OB-fold protein
MATPSTPRADLPTIEEESQPFWDAAREGRFLIKRCNACGKAHHYPRPFCPSCWSEDVVWEDASGKATLYTHSTVYVNDLPPFREKLPYIAAMVVLEEGPHVQTEIVGVASADELTMGMPLVVDFVALTDEITAPVFKPAS